MMSEKFLNRAPVIVSIGEIVDRPDDPRLGKEPLVLLAEALRRADEDAGGNFLRRLDSLDVINSITWGYADLPAQLSQFLDIHPKRASYGVIGGDTPIRYVHDAALRIDSGEIDFAAVCGAEATHSLLLAEKAQIKLPWTPENAKPEKPRREGIIHPVGLRHGLDKPLVVYPIYEYASQAAWGQTYEQAQNETGQLWSQLSSVAAANPYAWTHHSFEPSEITTPSGENRRVAGPYTKRMVANPTVNQGAAVMLTSFGQAKAMGIPEDRLIFVWGGSAASEPADFVSRDQYQHSCAMDAVLESAQALSASNRTNFDRVELYSCFPCVPKMARRILNWPLSKPSSVAGGLPFFGGPYNNYMTHATAAMVRSLRAPGGGAGLLFALGGFVTKHHALVVGTRPPVARLTPGDVQADADRRRAKVPDVEPSFVGRTTVETYTIIYDRWGEPTYQVVFALTNRGTRVIARVEPDDLDTSEFLNNPQNQVIGTPGRTSIGRNGLLYWSL
jgi:acetyl-CoA C-acetyltransferase